MSVYSFSDNQPAEQPGVQAAWTATESAEFAVSVMEWIDDLLNQAQVSGMDPLDKLNVFDTVSKRAAALIGPQARRAVETGCSWTEVGASLDITRQGAHQRYARAHQSSRAGAATVRGRDHPGWRMAGPQRSTTPPPDGDRPASPGGESIHVSHAESTG